MTDLPNLAYKILSRTDYESLVANSSYAGSPVDLADGYIHLSTEAQLEGTASKHYAGQSDLILIEVHLPALGEALIWEPSRGGALFPHIYAPLPLSATGEARPMAVSPTGIINLGQPLARP